jgi:hypothetical protein
MSANSLYRLVYASRATVVTVDDASVNANLARILMQSRKNNPPQGLVGALYYADGCFFQVLEGPRAAVDALYAKLHGDPRHRELKVLSQSAIQRLSFSGWSMKFVPQAAAVREVLGRYGVDRFDPYTLRPEALEDLVGLLVTGKPGEPAGADNKGKSTPVDPVALQARWMALAALVVSFVALAVATSGR